MHWKDLRMRRRMPSTVALLAMLAVALAGCTGDDDLGADAQLDYDDTGNGNHSDTADCDDEGTLTGSGTIDDGQVRVTVMDGDGQAVFEQTYDDSAEVEGERLEGASGTWRLEAQRSGDDVLGDEFRGGYVFRLDC